MEMCGETTPDNGEKSILQFYAPLCPYQYGTGVYIARALLAPIDSTDYSNSCENIIGNSYSEHKPIKKTAKPQTPNNPLQSLSALVYPNPANTILNVALFAGPGQAAELNGKVEYIDLYNQMGELVLSYKLTNSLTTIPVGSLVPGIYHYRIIDNNQNPIKADNILIIR